MLTDADSVNHNSIHENKCNYKPFYHRLCLFAHLWRTRSWAVMCLMYSIFSIVPSLITRWCPFQGLDVSPSCIFVGLWDHVPDIPIGDGKNVTPNVMAFSCLCVYKGHLHRSPQHVGKRARAQGHKHTISLVSSLFLFILSPFLFLQDLSTSCSVSPLLCWSCSHVEEKEMVEPQHQAAGLPFYVKHFYC